MPGESLPFTKTCFLHMCLTSGPEVIKRFSSSTQLSLKFQLLINVEIVKKFGKFMFKTQKLVIYPLTFMSRINSSLI